MSRMTGYRTVNLGILAFVTVLILLVALVLPALGAGAFYGLISITFVVSAGFICVLLAARLPGDPPDPPERTSL